MLIFFLVTAVQFVQHKFQWLQKLFIVQMNLFNWLLDDSVISLVNILKLIIRSAVSGLHGTLL